MIIYDNKGIVLLDVDVDDTSVRYKAIKGENSLTLKFSLAEHIEVPLGSYCYFKNETYTLMLPEDLTLNHRRSFEYTIVMQSDDAKAKRYKFVNPVDGRLKFSLTAKPVEHLQMFVDNMNMRDTGWSVGQCPEHVEIVLSYNHTFCHDALVQLADALELDYWFDGKTVNIGRLELNKDNPLPLSYGGDGQGLKPNIKRTNYSDGLPVEILYVQGGASNIDPSKYGSSELHLPKSQTIGYDGEYFENEDNFDASKARYYKTDANGYSIRRADRDVVNYSEDSLDCSEIIPTKEETIVSVVVVDKNDHFYDILISSDVNYKNYVIGGEAASVIFQSGMLAGKEFDLATDEAGNLICKKEGNYWRLEIVPQVIDGITMPDDASGFLPVKGDTFKVFGIQLPDEYISNNTLMTGAEWEMFKYAVKHMYANEDVQYTISGELDEIFAKRDWENIEGRLKLGSYISFSDKSFQAEPILIRIIGIKEYVNKPHSPYLEFSNATIGGTVVGSINRIENQEAYTEKIVSDSRKYTKRTFADAKRSIKMLEEAFGDGFDDSITPATIQTMMMLVGDERLQFAFVDSMTGSNKVSHAAYFDTATKSFKCNAGILMHYTIGISEIRSKYDQNYRHWTLPAFESGVLTDVDAEYYVYAVVDKEGNTGEFRLERTAIGLEDVSGKYHLLLGLLLSEYDGSRSFVSLYGFTEILPGQITTDVIRSADGSCVIDLVNNSISGPITFLPGTAGLENIEGWSDADNRISQALEGLDKINDDSFLTVEEKTSIRVDWITINGIASTTESSNTGSFYKARKAIIVYNSGDTKIVYDDTLYQYGGSDIVYNYSGLIALDAAYLDLRKYLDGIGLNEDTEYPAFNKSRYAELLKNYYDCEADIYYTISEEINAKAKAAQELAEGALTRTIIENGFVTTGTIMLGDEDANIKAGITGADTGDDAVRIWAGEALANRNDAPFRVAEDGSVYASNVTVSGIIETTKGKLGELEVLHDWVLSNYKDGNVSTEVAIRPNAFHYHTKDSSDSTELVIAMGHKTYGTSTNVYDYDGNLKWSSMYTNYKYGLSIDMTRSTGGSTSPYEYLAALHINASGPYVNNWYAIRCDSGMYAGFRPATRVITGSVTLDKYDCIVINKASSLITITLPASPVMGQYYKIISASTYYTPDIDFNGKSYDDYGDEGSQVIELIWDGSVWNRVFMSTYVDNSD